MTSPDVVTLGEALMVFNGPQSSPIDRGAEIAASFAGAEANVAIGLSRLGHTVRWLSVLGEDLFGTIILRGLRGEAVDVSGVKTSSSGPTALMVKNRRSFAEPEVFYYRAGSAFSRISPEAFAPGSWNDGRVLFLTGITPALSEGCAELIRAMVADVSARGAPLWIDPNFRRKLWSEQQFRDFILSLAPRVNVLLTGIEEGRILTGRESPVGIAAALRSAGVAEVVVKAGEDGAYYAGPEAQEHVPAFRISSAVDPIGAGDGFVAGFLSARLEGATPRAALEQGNAVGAIVASTEGDWEGLPTRSELARFLSRNQESLR